MIEINLIPEAKEICEASEYAKPFKCAVLSHEEAWNGYLDGFIGYTKKVHGVTLEKADGGIELFCDRKLKRDEYIFDSQSGGIKLYASDSEGALYALSTALQLLRPFGDKLSAPSVCIRDYPDKEYRGLMIDLARMWHPIKQVHKYIDLCFLYKIKYLHIHFIDDQSYTLPSKAFPEISTAGRHYTFEEIKELNDYASSRGIVLIPEFEAPGHATSLTKSYRNVFANKIDGKSAVMYTENGDIITDNSIVCAGSKDTEKAIDTLIGEICEMFPNSPYIHIGGDEANIKVWNNCSECRRYMSDNGIEDEYELYSDFIGRVAKIVLAKGRTPIVWEGFPKKGAHRVPKETVVIAWESKYHLAPDLLAAGFKIINASWKPLYIVPHISKKWNALDIMRWNVHRFENWWDESDAYLNPITIAPTDKLLGAQVSVWEGNFELSVSYVLENLPALAERSWNLNRRSDDAVFGEKHHCQMLIAGRLIGE